MNYSALCFGLAAAKFQATVLQICYKAVRLRWRPPMQTGSPHATQDLGRYSLWPKAEPVLWPKAVPRLLAPDVQAGICPTHSWKPFGPKRRRRAAKQNNSSNGNSNNSTTNGSSNGNYKPPPIAPSHKSVRWLNIWLRRSVRRRINKLKRPF